MTDPKSPPDPRVTPLQEALRQETRQLHDRVDGHAVLAPLVGDALDVAAYGRALTALHAALAPVEDRIEAFLARCPLPLDWPARRRMPDLDVDLRALGLARPAPAWAGPALGSTGALFGALYVLEGSTLGGQVIHRRVGRSLGLTAETGARYFAGRGEATGRMWRAYWEAAGACCAAEEIPHAACAAREVFEALLAELDRRAAAPGA